MEARPPPGTGLYLGLSGMRKGNGGAKRAVPCPDPAGGPDGLSIQKRERRVNCPACVQEGATRVLDQRCPPLGVLHLVRCTGCGLAYLDPQPEPEELAPFYARAYYGGDKGKFVPAVQRLRDALARGRAIRLARGLRPGSRVLDVGCGDGTLLAAFAALGYAGTGTERAGHPLRDRTEGSGFDVVAGELPAAGLPGGHFDLCVYWHSLEHLPDPRASLAETRRLLKPGGRVVIAVPNFESLQDRLSGTHWFHLDLPRHLFQFSPRSLAAVLVGAGFTVERIHHRSLEQNPFAVLQSALNRWTAGPDAGPNRLYDLLRRAGRPPSRTERFLQLAALALGMPVAVILSEIESLMGRGGTIEAWATRDGEP